MGKRMGLARMEALVEALNRDLNLENATLTDCNIVTSGSITHVGANGVGARRAMSSATSSGFGVHEYYEVISVSTADDNDVAGSATYKLPAGAIITDAALIPVELATSNHGNVALEVHSAAIADDAASAGTEIVGEDVSGNVSVPDNDCDLSSDATLGLPITMGTLANVQRAGDATFLQICAKEDLSSMTGTPKVGLYVRWVGKEAEAA